jgi:2-dehydropantoate 2-reductase
MRIAIFGTGGVGGHFGAELARAGHNVVFIARGDHLAAIRAHGLRVETSQREIVVHPATATDSPAEVGVVDAVIVGVKAWQVTQAAHAMRPLVGSDTVVIPLQNGVEAPARLVDVLGEAHVVGGLCASFSWVVGPGQIRSIGTTHFIKFGELNRTSSERVERLRQAFEHAGVKVEVPADMHAALWEKFLFVVPFGGVGAVTRSPIGVIRTIPETRRMLEDCMREILAVAQSRKIALREDAVDSAMRFVDSLAPSGTTSLQRDIAEGKPSELGEWTGAVVRLGREVRVRTPLHEFIYHCLLPQERRARRQVEFPT